jgi:signal peptidase I
VKRVVGLPGERVTIEGGEVKIDGKPISEPYAEGTTHCGSGDDCDIVLGDGEVFVLGDNRSNSVDSRSNGPVDLTRIRGKITKVLWPPALP